ncbi:hypothetical protein [Actinoplanes siamensis]|uniref:Uncharacterized protein n=1 Tax=Actinoplanes siamensis TaxID=1223317 RepID=A0A919N4U0_9ACTN|nr:hypothetical protein [Actinoplanes siamensis]GIF04395.1 hypothetical protein Asi03nite_19330 [Actinoplanes siamensis]
MTSPVVRQPRVVRDGVRAASGPGFAQRVRELPGPQTRAELAATRERLAAAWIRTGGDRSAGDLEAGRWRIRLEELLRARPDPNRAVVGLTARVFAL